MTNILSRGGADMGPSSGETIRIIGDGFPEANNPQEP
jgi:hypothetical protein